jgi:hypothetical protein
MVFPPRWGHASFHHLGRPGRRKDGVYRTDTAKQCQVEFENGSGATMRVQLVGYDAADIEALARGIWSDL